MTALFPAKKIKSLSAGLTFDLPTHMFTKTHVLAWSERRRPTTGRLSGRPESQPSSDNDPHGEGAGGQRLTRGDCPRKRRDKDKRLEKQAHTHKQAVTGLTDGTFATTLLLQLYCYFSGRHSACGCC